MFEMNPYDLAEPFELQDDEVTRIARRQSAGECGI